MVPHSFNLWYLYYMWGWIAFYVCLGTIWISFSVKWPFPTLYLSFSYQFIRTLSLLSVLQIANIFLSSCIITVLFLLTVSFLYICFIVLNQIVRSFHERKNISFEYHQECAFQIFQPHTPAKFKRRETCFCGGGQVWTLIITGAPMWVVSPIPFHVVTARTNQFW